ncbi:hypothetical protein [Flavobacterium sp. 25HG05S-40]|uniref:hypothetical protein n=1 Tax=Flavobacterium sp. 25HG05S-40 TaxID=3458682 RepID=UPI004043B27D
MKTILKNSLKTAAIALCLLSSTMTFAQETTSTTSSETKNYDQGFRLGFGLSGGVPVNAEPYEFNIGGDVRLQYDLSTKYSLTFTTGFNNFFINGDDNDLGYIPVKGGFKAFVLKDQLYLLGEVGAAFAVTNDYDDSSFLFSPGIGYANKYFDASLRYEHYTNFPKLNNDGTTGKGLGMIALRLAYGFKI